MTLWRKVLSALNDDTLDSVARGVILARAAVQLAIRKIPPGCHPTVDGIMAVAFEEFAVVLDADQASAALRECREIRVP